MLYFLAGIPQAYAPPFINYNSFVVTFIAFFPE